MMEVLRDIQGLGFDTFSWFKDWSQWLNVSKSTTVEECWIGTGFVDHTVDFDSFACDCGRIFVDLEI